MKNGSESQVLTGDLLIREYYNSKYILFNV